MNSTEFICICGKQKTYVSHGQITKACPTCSRRYLGIYNPSKLGVEPIELSVEKVKEIRNIKINKVLTFVIKSTVVLAWIALGFYILGRLLRL